MKKIRILLLSALCLFTFSTSVFASDWNMDYTYSPKNSRVPIPQCYTVEKVITSFQAENAVFKAPTEIKIDKDNNIFVADTDNNRVVKLDSAGNFVQEFTEADGKPFNKPHGIYIASNGDLYIADTDNSRVVHLDTKGSFIESFVQPASKLFNTSFSFKPTKVAVDSRGYLNILNGTDYHGIILLDAYNEFQGYLGMNRTTPTLFEKIAAEIATPEQKAIMDKQIPAYNSSIFSDNNGYIYATTVQTDVNQIKKLNAVGTNTLLDGGVFGETNFAEDAPHIVRKPNFEDIYVDKNGIITTVDSSSKRLYQYDQDGGLLCVFGGPGEVGGKYSYPISVAGDSQNRLYVLDRDRATIQVLKPTLFLSKIHEAIGYYQAGAYEKAVTPWNEVLNIDSTYLMAHRQIGKVLFKQEKYKESMREYTLAEDRDGYSIAFSKYRHRLYRQYFIPIVIVTAVSLAVLIKILFFLKKKADKYQLGVENK